MEIINKNNYLDLYKHYAELNNGKCLTTKYTSPLIKILWECNRKHQFYMSYRIVRMGCWCEECTYEDRRAPISQIQELAIQKGGKLLSTSYKNSKTKLEWECSKKHIWSSTWTNIRRGSWCSVCAKNKKLTIEEVKALAISKDGYCLSKYYINARSKLIWKCHSGHIWNAPYKNISNNHWCPECNNVGIKELICKNLFNELFNNIFIKCRLPEIKGIKNWPLELDGYCAELRIAFEHNGQQHYFENLHWHRTDSNKFLTTLINDKIKKEKCNELGIKLFIIPELFTMTKIKYLISYIEFQAKIFNVNINKSIDLQKIITKSYTEKYPKIEIKKVKKTGKYTIDKLRQIAINQNGLCLSEMYNNIHSMMEWYCNKCQFSWIATASCICYGKTWCPKCAKKYVDI